MIRIAIDAHIVDKIVDTTGFLLKVQAAAKKDCLIIISNHIVRDQLVDTPDVERRERLLDVYDSLPKKEVPTWGGIWGLSQWGKARWGDGSGSGVAIEDVRTGGRGGSQDAVIATTASGDADVLVTEDKHLRKKLEKSTAHCEVWDFSKFETFVHACIFESPEMPCS
jgi:hypothetical protein